MAYFLFFLDIFPQTISSSFLLGERFTEVVPWIGPRVITKLQKFVNIVIILMMFANTLEFVMSKYIVVVGKVLQKILFVVVQFSLILIALNFNNLRSLIAIILAGLILIRPKVARLIVCFFGWSTTCIRTADT
jgi:hypothetical protein